MYSVYSAQHILVKKSPVHLFKKLLDFGHCNITPNSNLLTCVPWNSHKLRVPNIVRTYLNTKGYSL